MRNYYRKSIVALSILVNLLYFISPANAVGIEYTLNPQSLEIQNGSSMINITANQSPHYQFYDITNDSIVNHFWMLNVFEYLDLDNDGTFSSQNDTMIAPLVSLNSLDWAFKNFISESDSGFISKLEFDIRGASRFNPIQPNLEVSIHNVLSVAKQNELNLTISLNGWTWKNADSKFVLAIVLARSSDDNSTSVPVINEHNGKIGFANGYLAYNKRASYNNFTSNVNVSIAGETEQHDGALVYFCLPNYEDTTLSYTITLGLLEANQVNYTTATSTTSITYTTTTTSRLIDSNRLLSVSIGATVLIGVIIVLFLKNQGS